MNYLKKSLKLLESFKNDKNITSNFDRAHPPSRLFIFLTNTRTDIQNLSFNIFIHIFTNTMVLVQIPWVFQFFVWPKVGKHISLFRRVGDLFKYPLKTRSLQNLWKCVCKNFKGTGYSDLLYIKRQIWFTTRTLKLVF